MSEHSAENDTPAMREEWAVRHAQGTYTGSSYGPPLTEREARKWAELNAARDDRRRIEARGKTKLLRRYVTAWEEVPASVTSPGSTKGGVAAPTETSTKSTGEVVDLLAALQRSVAAAKEGRVTPPAKAEADR